MLARRLNLPWAGYNLTFDAVSNTVSSFNVVLASFGDVATVLGTEKQTEIVDHRRTILSSSKRQKLALQLKSGRELLIYDWEDASDRAVKSVADAASGFLGVPCRWEYPFERRERSD